MNVIIKANRDDEFNFDVEFSFNACTDEPSVLMHFCTSDTIELAPSYHLPARKADVTDSERRILPERESVSNVMNLTHVNPLDSLNTSSCLSKCPCYL